MSTSDKSSPSVFKEMLVMFAPGIHQVLIIRLVFTFDGLDRISKVHGLHAVFVSP